MIPFDPEPLPIASIEYGRLARAIGEANAAVARFDALLRDLPPALAVALSLTTGSEAVVSSRIEGTRATLGDVLAHEAGLEVAEPLGRDIQEIRNYRDALGAVREELVDRPIRLHLVRELHRRLMSGVRGQERTPGQFRTTQNYIGRPGATLAEASFVPPTPLRMVDALAAWERYLDRDDEDPIVQTAVMHAQFELIHPFGDGNGRVGRMLIPLFLNVRGVIAHPTFYLSEYLERHRDAYYARLNAISARGEWTGWVEFFLKAVIAQASTNLHRIEAIDRLRATTGEAARPVIRSPLLPPILDEIFASPVFVANGVASRVAGRTGAHPKTVSGIVRQLRELGIVVERHPARGRRPAILALPTLMRLVGDVPVVGDF